MAVVTTAPEIVHVAGFCTCADQAIGVQDQCDVYSAMLETYRNWAIDGYARGAPSLLLTLSDRNVDADQDGATTPLRNALVSRRSKRALSRLHGRA